jgi:tetratricopeptide (TPR) repeat protein
LVWLPRASVQSYVRNAHSLYVETLVEVGLVGLILLVAFLVLALGTAVLRVVRSQFEERTLAASVAAALCAFVVSAASDWFWQVPVLPVAFLLLASAVLAPSSRARTEAAATPSRRAWIGRAGVIVVAGACLVVIGIPMASTIALRKSQAAAATGDPTAALADARSALAIEPQSASAHLQVALVLELRRDVPDALTAARAATASEPDNWQTWLVLSRLQAEAGAPQAAIAAMRRARSLNPQSSLF